jgi:DNA repair protein RecN (Recombination protein N)
MMEDLDIEQVLDRIEKLSSLIKRFGSIEEAIEYKTQKEKELESYENISFEKSILEKNIKKLNKLIEEQSSQISHNRKSVIDEFTLKINEYLKLLYLDDLSISLEDKEIDFSGKDSVVLKLKSTLISKVSSGEFNRIRLAFMTARCFYEKDASGVLFLDEVDANLSGKESESIAKVLLQLSKNYQIFAISHQPQLSAAANQHFMVYKQNDESEVVSLNKENRVNEIARMISGKDITKEALEFSKKLLA